MHNLTIVILAALLLACGPSNNKSESNIVDSTAALIPSVVTDSVKYDSDDPAIWINHDNPAESLVLGTDKGSDSGDGAIFVFNLQGNEIPGKTVRNIKRPNNIDVAYNFEMNDTTIDIAVCTERNTNSLRVFRVPDMKEMDGGGIPVFENDTARSPMGIALFTTRRHTYAIVSRKSGPDEEYLCQYLLKPDGDKITGELVRKFGKFGGGKEIESVAVDNELGYVYYSDEGAGIRKYYAHPDSSNRELAFFGENLFKEDNEGISIYKSGENTGYILVSDQAANQFHIFSRNGNEGNPHDHQLVKTIKTSTIESDGSDVTSIPLPGFPKGLFVAMSDDKTFQYYSWEQIME